MVEKGHPCYRKLNKSKLHCNLCDCGSFLIDYERKLELF